MQIVAITKNPQAVKIRYKLVQGKNPAIGPGLPAVSSAQAAGQRVASANNLRQIAMAMLTYVTINNEYFPPAYSADKTTGKPLLSWRVAILPYLGEETLYRQFHLDEPWNSEHNMRLIARTPQVFRSPASHAAAGMTNYPKLEALTAKFSIFGLRSNVSPLAVGGDSAEGVVVKTYFVDFPKSHAMLKSDDSLRVKDRSCFSDATNGERTASHTRIGLWSNPIAPPKDRGSG